MRVPGNGWTTAPSNSGDLPVTMARGCGQGRPSFKAGLLRLWDWKVSPEALGEDAESWIHSGGGSGGGGDLGSYKSG